MILLSQLAYLISPELHSDLIPCDNDLPHYPDPVGLDIPYPLHVRSCPRTHPSTHNCPSLQFPQVVVPYVRIHEDSPWLNLAHQQPKPCVVSFPPEGEIGNDVPVLTGNEEIILGAGAFRPCIPGSFSKGSYLSLLALLPLLAPLPLLGS
jgi:hypothetical protein